MGNCMYCRAMWEAELSLPDAALSQRASYASSPIPPNSPKEPRASEDSHFSIPLWRREPKDKGKEPAEDQEWYSPLGNPLQRPREHSPELPPFCPTAPVNGIVIREAVQHQQTKPVRCSFSVTPLDPRQIPVPTLPGLRPRDSAALNLSDPCHTTGRLFNASPLEGGRLFFPLPKNPLPQPTPELKAQQCFTSAPEPLLLEDYSQAPTTRESVDMPSLLRRRSKATRIQQGGFHEPITLLNASSTNSQSAITSLLQPLRDTHPMSTSQKRKVIHRNPSSPVHSLPTLSGSRNNSGSTATSIPHLTFGTTGSLPPRPVRPTRVPPSPAAKDPRVCTLSDTTGSPLPDCPVYVSPREARDRKNDGLANRHWPGGCIWRYHCED